MQAGNPVEILLKLVVIIGSIFNDNNNTVATTVLKDSEIAAIKLLKAMSNVRARSLQQSYHKESEFFKMEETSITDVSDIFSTGVQTLLVSRKRLLNNIKHTAIRSMDAYVYNAHMEPYNYYNRRHQPPNPVELETRFSTKVKVNLSRSHVQCSTEIFMNSNVILNNAKATEPLNEAFRRNYKEEPSLLWQFFCSILGTHRSYPGKK